MLILNSIFIPYFSLFLYILLFFYRSNSGDLKKTLQKVEHHIQLHIICQGRFIWDQYKPSSMLTNYNPSLLCDIKMLEKKINF